MIEIYKDFELITIDPVYTDFIWRRRFSRAGEFQLITNFTTEKLSLFAQGNVIYKRNVDEAGFIESRNVIQTIDNDLMLVVRGRFLPSLLDRRVVTLTGDFNLPTLLDDIISNNFLASAGHLRSIAPVVRLLPSMLPSINVSVEYQRRNVYDAVVNLLQVNNNGMRVQYNLDNRTFDISFYQPAETDVVFSKEFANIIEQDYRDDNEGYRNVVYVEDQYIHNNHLHSGLERREVAVSAPRAGSTTLSQTARDALNEHKAVRTLSSVVNPFNKQFEYLKDWDIGSVVTSENRTLGYSEREVITEITEFYDQSGLNLEVNLGDYIERGDMRVSSHR
ncbi:MAG: siphovirus ReqiPepy6 Gp37-like family protein [Defluviitaleaceae bacterium]|nr:siphovirus ReqiPepy6 Gp37-like family protein [Defluviitaleaceae bacterium]